MEEPCFCSVEDIVNCLIEKTKISLPVILTACALGYIWTARKQMNDMKKQCIVLEDDMKNIKRENFKLGEEIRRLKCTVSDTDLLSIAISKCNDNMRPKTRQCFLPEKTFIDNCAGENRCISRKMKKRRSRTTSPACSAKDLQIVSFSTPEILNDFLCDTPLKSKPNCNKLHLPSFEWSPRAESTKIEKDNCNECDYQFEEKDITIKKPDTVSFYTPTCFEPKTKKYDFMNSSCRDKRSRKCTKKRSKIQNSIQPSFNCYSCDQKKKPQSPKTQLKVCISDLLICNGDLNEQKSCKRPTSMRNPFTQVQDECPCPYSNCDDVMKGCKFPKIVFQSADECPPKNVPKSTRIKETIEKYRNDLTKDINSLTNPSSCMHCRKSKQPCEIIDLTECCNSSNLHKYKSSTKKPNSRNISSCR